MCPSGHFQYSPRLIFFKSPGNGYFVILEFEKVFAVRDILLLSLPGFMNDFAACLTMSCPLLRCVGSFSSTLYSRVCVSLSINGFSNIAGQNIISIGDFGTNLLKFSILYYEVCDLFSRAHSTDPDHDTLVQR